MFSPRGKHFGKNKLPEMMELFKIAKPLFDVNLISFDSGLNKFAKRRKTRIIWVKLAASYLIFGAVCLNGLYSILFTKSGIVETSFILLVILVFFLAMIIFSPMLIRPGPFVSLLNGRQAFILENIRANFLSKLISLDEFLRFSYFINLFTTKYTYICAVIYVCFVEDECINI